MFHSIGKMDDESWRAILLAALSSTDIMNWMREEWAVRE